MHVLFDTNVLLDALLERQHAEEAYFLLDQALERSLEGAATPTVLINTFSPSSVPALSPQALIQALRDESNGSSSVA